MTHGQDAMLNRRELICVMAGFSLALGAARDGALDRLKADLRHVARGSAISPDDITALCDELRADWYIAFLRPRDSPA